MMLLVLALGAGCGSNAGPGRGDNTGALQPLARLAPNAGELVTVVAEDPAKTPRTGGRDGPR